MHTQESIKSFKKVYQDALTGPKIALFLGSGVSHASDIPNYTRFALETFVAASKEPDFNKNIDSKIITYINKQLILLNSDKKKIREEVEIKPDEVFLLIRKYFKPHIQSYNEWIREWLNFCSHELYRRNYILIRGSWKIKGEVYAKNKTLNSLIAFCKAKPDDVGEPWNLILKLSDNFKSNTGINPRIGGIITTNYDALFEAAFNHKNTRSKGTKYGMRPLMEGVKKVSYINSLPVAHIHGFLAFGLDDKGYLNKSKYKNKLSDIVISETDYFKTFYKSMTFSNYSAMSYLDSYHTVFIGSKMEDKNIRRFLYHLKQESDTGTEKFAVMNCKCKKHREDKYGTFTSSCLDNSYLFTQEVLAVYGVKVIWLCNHDQIPGLFEDVYRSTQPEGDWDYVYN